MAENNEIARRVFMLPHWGQAMDESAFDIARRTSKCASQSEHLYSYSGIFLYLNPPLGIVPLFNLTVKPPP
jgi:hypothetical protein